jgi:hypothetical protein
MGLTQPPYPMGNRGSFPGVKRPGREADHSPPSSAEVKEWVELYLHSTNKPSWRGAQLKHRDKFTFYGQILGLYVQTVLSEVSVYRFDSIQQSFQQVMLMNTFICHMWK